MIALHRRPLVVHPPVVSAHRLRGAALVAMLMILAAVAVAVLASAEWMAPASSAAIPG